MLTGRVRRSVTAGVRWRLEDVRRRVSASIGDVRAQVLGTMLTCRLTNREGVATDERTLVSMTSYPPRFGKLHLTLLSLLNQTVRPTGIELWVAHADLDALPAAVRALSGSRLRIRACDDLRSYKKVVPAILEDPDRVIVTADDDVYYWPGWLEELVAARREHPGDVLCHRGHAPVHMEDGSLAPYSQWRFEVRQEDAPNVVFPTGMGGVLYPPRCFHDSVCDTGRFMELCPTADDVWLFWMAALNGRAARTVGRRRRFDHWVGSQDVGLYRTNLQGAADNDRQIRNMVLTFGLPGSLRGRTPHAA